jgi:hypothetical protein
MRTLKCTCSRTYDVINVKLKSETRLHKLISKPKCVHETRPPSLHGSTKEMVPLSAKNISHPSSLCNGNILKMFSIQGYTQYLGCKLQIIQVENTLG